MPAGALVKVLMLDDSTNSYDIKPANYGNVLIQAIMKDLDVLESDYFGAALVTDDGLTFLDPLRQINKQIKKISDTTLEFVVKFYSPDPSQLEDEYTRYLLALQVKRDIQNGLLPCAENTAVRMASFIAQAEFGDWNSEECFDTTYLEDLKLMHNTTARHLQLIREQHRKLVGKTPAEADYSLLDIARRLEHYGVRLHPALDAQNMPISLGVCHSGVLVFQDDKKINGFNWARIRKLSFKRKRFMIKLRTESMQKGARVGDILIFSMRDRDACKNFWRLCIEHHAFFRLEIRPKPKPKPMLLSRGSSFHYNGKTQKELLDLVRNSNFRRTNFVRTTSRRRTQNSVSSPSSVIEAKKFRPENNFPTQSSNKSNNVTPESSITSPVSSPYTDDQASYTIGDSSQHSPSESGFQTTTQVDVTTEGDQSASTPEWQLESKSLHSSAMPIEDTSGVHEQTPSKGKPVLGDLRNNTTNGVIVGNGQETVSNTEPGNLKSSDLSHARGIGFAYSNTRKNDSDVPMIRTLGNEQRVYNSNLCNNNASPAARAPAMLPSAPPLPPKERHLSSEVSHGHSDERISERQTGDRMEYVSSGGFDAVGQSRSKDPFVNDSVINLAGMAPLMTPELKAKIGEQKIKIGHYSVPKKPPAPPAGEGHVSPLWNRHSQILDKEVSEAMSQLYDVINQGSKKNEEVFEDFSSSDENEYTVNGTSVMTEPTSPEDDPRLAPIEMDFDDSPDVLSL